MAYYIFKKLKTSKFGKILLLFSFIFLTTFLSFKVVLAATSPWSQSDWSTNNFSTSSNVTTSTANQVTLTKQEKLTNLGFETNLTGWTANTTTFGDSSFLAASGAVAAWPLDDTTSTQSYARVLNPAVATGRNIIINGGFDTNTIWNYPGTNWTIAGGVAHNTGATDNNNLYQAIPDVIGKAYQVTFTVSNYVSGSVRAKVGNLGAGTLRTANGTYTETIIAQSDNFFTIQGFFFAGDIDNVSVTQINIPASNSTPTQLLTDGDMEASGTAGWGNGASTLSKQSGTPHGGLQVLRVAWLSVLNPTAFQQILTVGREYRVTGYGRGDGTHGFQVYSGGTLFTGTSSTLWQPFDFTFVATDINFNLMVVASSAGYAEFDDVTVSLDTGIRQGEIAQDGGFETWTNATTPTYWTKSTVGGSTVNQESSIVHSGSSALRFDVDSSNNSVNVSQIGTIVYGKTYHVGFWAKASVNGATISTDTFSNISFTLTTSYKYYEFTAVPNALAAFDLKRGSGDASTSIYIDDVSITEVDPLVGIPTNGVTFPTTSSGHLTNAYSFDGINDFVNIYSSDLNSIFNPNEGTMVAWAKVSSAGVWTDGATRTIYLLRADANNYFYILKPSDNRLQLVYASGGSTLAVLTTVSSVNWMQIAFTWSKSSDQLKMYIDGVQVGTTQTGLGTWVGNLSSSLTIIGAADSTGALSWSGLINDVRLYNTALSATNIANLYAGVTATRDTSVKLSGTASSKVVAPEGNGTFVQSVNVGDTNQYNLSANVYIDGSTVADSSYASLYYNGSTIATTYTSLGGGWTKLTGTITGVNTSVDAGIQIQGGRTIYVDDMSLNNYTNTSGTLTSSIFDSGLSSNWGILTYVATTPTNTTLSVKVRAGNQSDLSDAAAFSSCTAIASGTTVGGTTCVTNGMRYAQYLLTFTSSDLLNTPTFTSFSLPFNQSFVVALDSPANNSYTNSQRPTFQWEKTSSSSGVGKYILEIDNPGSSIIVDNIPTSRTTDLTTNKYVIHYDTNSISFYTKSSSEWGPNENDGNLRDGTIGWKVTAVDNAGNSTSSSRTLFVDTVPPVLSNVTISNTNLPTISGKLTDTFSGPDSVDIKIEKKNIFGSYDLYLDANVNTTNGSFSFTPDSPLPNGTYKITVTGKDKAGNLSVSTILSLTVPGGTITPIQTPIPTSTPEGVIPAPSTSPTTVPTVTPAPTTSSGIDILKTIAQVWNTYVNFVSSTNNFFIGTTKSFGNTIANAFNIVKENYIAFANYLEGVNRSIALALGNGVVTITSTIASVFSNTINNIAVALGTGYENIANSAPGITRNILLTFRNIFNTIGHGIGNIAVNIRSTFFNIGNALANVWNNTTHALALAWKNTTTALGHSFGNLIASINRSIENSKTSISDLALRIGERFNDISSNAGQFIISLGYQLDREPTKITNVAVAILSSTSVKISWDTNRPATGKVNYGLDETYPLEIQSTKLTQKHEFTLTNLKPNTQYSFEVMSHGKNYVYDANRKFTTPKN